MRNNKQVALREGVINTKPFIIGLIVLISLLFVGVKSVEAARVRGSIRKNGTYVQPHYRSNPNSKKWDNYSSKGNYNPYTGKKGYKSLW